MQTTRRIFLRQAAATCLAAPTFAGQTVLANADRPRKPPLIIDTHQHLWDLDRFQPPWLPKAPEVLRHNYRTPEYLEATRGWNVKAIYMEVDFEPARHIVEAEHVVTLSRSDDHPTIAAVVGGRPAAADFGAYVKRLTKMPEIKGVRQVLHGKGTPAGFCLQKTFVQGVRLLGRHGLSFDLCLRPAELADGLKLTRLCPDTRFIVDHCGNADPKAFAPAPADTQPWHDADQWRRDTEALAQQSHVICKISGIVSRAPQGWQAEHLAPIVNHCLDVFGSERVVFGGDWPVCLKGAKLRQWIEALAKIISERPEQHQTRLWQTNAIRFYGLRL